MPPKHENGGKKRPQNHKVGAESAPTQIRAEKVWGQKVPSKCKSGGKKRRQNSKVTAKSATTQMSDKKVMVAESAIKMEKWWRKMPSKQQSDGRKCHHFTTLVELQPPYQYLRWYINHHISYTGCRCSCQDGKLYKR